MKTQTQWLVEPNLNISKVDVVYDGKKPMLFCRYDDDGYTSDELYYIEDNMKLFTTESDATKYAKETFEKLKARFPEVKKFLITVMNLDEELYPVNNDDFIPSMLTDTYYKKEYQIYQKENSILTSALRTGFLNINAVSFKPGDVTCIKWFNKCDKEFACILLENGMEVETYSEEEMEIIRTIFGRNHSGRIYKK